MDIAPRTSIRISDQSQIGEARRTASALAKSLGFDETAAGKVALVATEVASNIFKHAGKGEVVVQAVFQDGITALDLFALDTGSGIADMGRAMSNGFSSTGTAGIGFGAVARQSDLFDVHSTVTGGTAILCRFYRKDRPPNGAIGAGGICVPVASETVSGDSWSIVEKNGKTLVFVVDGLGHGIFAAEAARQAVKTFERNAGATPEQIMHAVDADLRPTRGAAAAVAAIDPARKKIVYCGVGNISGAIWGDERPRSMVSHNGTLGHHVYKIAEFEYVVPAGRSLLIMSSDGLSSHVELNKYPGLAARHPALIAAVLYRDYSKKRDDATAVVVRLEDGAS